MTKPKLLAVFPPDHYALRNLDAIRDKAEIAICGSKEDVAAHGQNADIVLYSGAAVAPFADVWKSVPNVKWVHSLSAGVEKLLIPEFISSPVPLTNARGVFKRSLADFAVLGILYFYKHVRRLVDNQRARKWDDFSVEWLPGKVMAVVGYGEIGRECARLAKALGLVIHALRRNPERSLGDEIVDRAYGPAELHSMLAEADVVLAAAPLTPETHHMLSTKEFAAMKNSAIVINVGRGPVVDEQALVTALKEGQIQGAALDVFEVEPLPQASELWAMENVLISPHCTDRTRNPDWLDLSMQLFVENFQRYIAGQPLANIVDKRAGY